MEVIKTHLRPGAWVLVTNHNVYSRYNMIHFLGSGTYTSPKIGSIFQIHSVESHSGKLCCWPKELSGVSYYSGIYESECIPATKIVKRFWGKK